MLVLSRRERQRLVVITPEGRTLTIAVDKVGRGKVRIGIEAPDDYVVLRGELIDGNRKN